MSKPKNYLTKRKILISVNVMCSIILFISCLLTINEVTHWNADDLYYFNQGFLVVVGFVLAQCVFTSLSLIVYYLAIMAEALNKKYKDEVEDNTENKK